MLWVFSFSSFSESGLPTRTLCDVSSARVPLPLVSLRMEEGEETRPVVVSCRWVAPSLWWWTVFVCRSFDSLPRARFVHSSSMSVVGSI